MKQEISPDALFGGAGLEWGRHIAVEDRRPTCVFAIFPNSTPCPQSASLPSLEGPLTALDWLTGCLLTGGRADWRVKLDCDVRPSGPLHLLVSPLNHH